MNKKEDKNTRMDREKLLLLATCIEHLIKEIKHPISGCANPGSSESDTMSV